MKLQINTTITRNVILGLLLITTIWVIAIKIQERIVVKKVHEAYRTIYRAYNETVKDKSITWEKGKVDNDKFADAFLKHLKVKTDCRGNKNGICIANEVKYAKPYGPDTYSPLDKWYSAKLENGMSIAFNVLSPDCSLVRNRCATILFDINGTKGPNRLSKDLFDLGIYKDKVKPYSVETNHVQRCLEGTGQSCTDYILRFHNTNYKNYIAELKKERQIQADKQSKYLKRMQYIKDKRYHKGQKRKIEAAKRQMKEQKKAEKAKAKAKAQPKAKAKAETKK